MNQPQEAMAKYQQLLAKVDAKFAAIHARYASSFQCRAGCFDCCQPGLTISPIEQESIQQYLALRPALKATVQELLAQPAHGDMFCPMLDAEGRCSIYEVRPIICRSHGAPIRFAIPEGEVIDACPLNFTDMDIDDLPEDMFINIDQLNVLLALLNKMFVGEQQSTQRTAIADLTH